MNLIQKVSLLAAASWCAVASVQAENVAAVGEVLKLRSAGMSEDTIVAFIQSRNENYDLSADAMLRLRDQGVSASVLNAMLSSGKAPSAPTAAVSPAQIVAPAPQVAAPTTTMSQPAAAAPAAVSPATTSPDVAYFYQELSPYGRWILVEDGRWCWQPSIVATTPDWRPYWDKGNWVWTDQGWYWTSDYSWGWAPFHYGRWHLHPHHGWIWFPDRGWGPAWVVWRSGDDYCGWAPLPPGAVFDTVGGRFTFHGRGVEVGFDFGLDFAHFTFCLSRDMGQPIRQHFRPGPEIRNAYQHTTIINNYTVKRTVVGGESRAQVFNHGVDASRITPAKGRSFEPVKIQDQRTPGPERGHEHLDPQHKTLDVYRPGFGGPH